MFAFILSDESVKKMAHNSPKRIKLDGTVDQIDTDISAQDRNVKITSVLVDHLTRPVNRKIVFIGIISDTKQTSKIILELSQLLPIADLNHLKRVRKNQIILCPQEAVNEYLLDPKTNAGEAINMFVSECVENNCDWALELVTELKRHRRCGEDKAEPIFDINSTISSNYFFSAVDRYTELRAFVVKLYLKERQLTENVIKNICEDIRMTEVPCDPPVLHWQYEEANACWPCKFHRNKYLENLSNNRVFSETETAFHLRIMSLCKYLSKEMHTRSVGVAVDPRTSNIVAIGIDHTDVHPLMHCPMVLIDMVARSQNGGAWNDWDLVDNDETVSEREPEQLPYTMNGVKSAIKKLMSNTFDDLAFGAEEVKNCASLQITDQMDATADNLTKYGPYLCTGYDVYLLREPCVMCGMALVHSRVRKVFFHETTTKGAIHTLTKIHTMKALNHHYEVFRIH